ncbi:MAG TPA: hypothetical protein VGH28_33670 [Polyangiaceae bacterium]|jgi:hypothetical protein
MRLLHLVFGMVVGCGGVSGEPFHSDAGPDGGDSGCGGASTSQSCVATLTRTGDACQ